MLTARLLKRIAGETWQSRHILLIASMGEELTEDERIIFKQLTGRDHEPKQRVDQFVAVVGRRGGKSRSMATKAAYLAGLCDHTVLSYRASAVFCCASTKRTSRKMKNYPTT